MIGHVFNNKMFLIQKVKLYFLMGFVLLLSACGGPEPDECNTIMSSAISCPLCTFYNLISKSASSIANSAWNKQAGPLSKAVLSVAAIYIAVFTLKMVGSFGKQTVEEYLSGNKNGLFHFMFKATIIYLLLVENGYFLNMVIVPLLTAGAEIGTTLSFASGSSFSPGSGGGWKDVFGMLSQTAEQFNNACMRVVSLGEAFMCNSVSGPGHQGFFNWDLLMLLYGAIVFVFGWILLAGVSFYLVDIMVRMTFAAALLPLGIACAISGLSVPYSKSIWGLFLNVFFSLIMLGILLGIVVCVALSCLGDGPSPNLAGYSVDIAGLMAGNDVEALSEAMINFGNIVLIVVCFCIMLHLIEEVGGLAGEISDTVGISKAIAPGSQAATPIAKGAVKEGTKFGKWAGNKVIVKPTKYAGHVFSRATRLDVLSKRISNKMEAARGKWTGTGRQGYRAVWRTPFKETKLGKLWTKLRGTR